MKSVRKSASKLPKTAPARTSRRSGAEPDWHERMLVRGYEFPPSGTGNKGLSVRMDYGGAGYWFPLGTSDWDLAEIKARAMDKVFVEQGWEAVCLAYSRELIVGLEWCANPILWTYTTIHTLVNELPPGLKNNEAEHKVLLVEEDVGVRRALEWCINQQAGFMCLVCPSAESFSMAFDNDKPDLVLLNRAMAERLGIASPGQMASLPSGISVLTYSVVADGDHLFVSTPGGAQGYMLKRARPSALLEPILDPVGRPVLSAQDLLLRVKAYFKELLSTKEDTEASCLNKLTRREREVLSLLSKGCVDKEIAQTLGISAWTVHGHIKNIFERLHVRTRTEAVVRYLEK